MQQVSPWGAVLIGGVVGLCACLGMALLLAKAGDRVGVDPPRAEQDRGFIIGSLYAANILLGGILGVLLFQATR